MTTPMSVANFIGDIKPYVYNPAGMQRAIMAAFDAMNNGQISVVDASNPFVFALETTCANASAIMQQAAALTRRQYPAAATSFDELYLHMADTDYASIFALPAQVNFSLVINESELLNALVLDAATGISKVTIPRNSVFYASDIPFSLQYPIDIRKLQHGALQIVYDVSAVSPLQNIATNVIDYVSTRAQDGTDYIQFSFNLQQFAIKSITSPFNSTSGSAITIPFIDQFYAARAYVSNVDGTWKEIGVTYTEQVYDPLSPTVVLQVLDGALSARLPLVYITSGLVSGSLRVDVYQTKGPLDLQLGNYSPSNFTAEFMSIDQNDTSPYITAFKNLTSVAPFSTDRTTGGRAALTFDELQQRVIQNSVGPRNLPITPSQIQSALLDSGYTLVKNIDTLTNRIYWATKALPAPTSPNLVTTANTNVATIATQIGQAETLQGCYSHATGMTISPTSVVQAINGISSLVTRAAYQQLMQMQLSDLVSAVNASDYSYTPFYYVLDNTTDTFVVRPYWLDSPVVSSRSFIQENPDTGLQASVAASYSFSKTAAGYRLTLTTTSNDAYKALADSEVFCQIGFLSAAQSARAYMQGVQQPRAKSTDERVFVFDFTTVYDVDVNDALALTSFTTNTVGYIPRAALEQSFDIIMGTTNAQALQVNPTTIDNFIGAFQFSQAVIGITHETLTLVFGYALTTLWNSFRSFTNLIPFQTYAADVPATYTQDVYTKDPVTGATFTIVNGQVTWNIANHKGDLVLDSSGNQVYLHKAGDPVLDIYDRPVPVANYQTLLTRAVDLVTLDGVYQFATDSITQAYVSQINSALLNSLTQDLVELNQQALEKTEIYYYPAVTQGTINVLVDNNQLAVIDAAQSLKVSLYVDDLVYNNKTLVGALQSSTVKTIGSFLAANTTVSNSELQDALMRVYGSDVLSVSVSGLGGASNFTVVSVTDDSTRLSIRKILQLLPSGQIAVQEDISVAFTIHGLTS